MTKYFITGGSGFIGSKVISLLKKQGHQVVALARSEKSASSLKSLGADDIIYGDLSNIEALTKGAKSTDGVIHLGFIHDFSNFGSSIETDLNAIKAFENALQGTNKSFVSTAGTMVLVHPIGTPKLDETYDNFDAILNTHLGLRLKNELHVLGLKNKGIRSTVVRLSPSVHNEERAGFATYYLFGCLKNKVAGYIGDGLNAWTSIHVDDAASLFVAAAERGIAGHAYHGIGEESITIKEMAETIAKKYDFPLKSLSPEEAGKVYGFLGNPLGLNITATAEITKKELDWEPKGTGLLKDLRTSDFLAARKEFGIDA